MNEKQPHHQCFGCDWLDCRVATSEGLLVVPETPETQSSHIVAQELLLLVTSGEQASMEVALHPHQNPEA